MSTGPPSSHLCLLSSLPSRAEGNKVRFLGCVLSYSTTTGHLKLAHNYPQGTNVTAVVDANLILESLSHEHTRVGEWVNILGYVGGKQRVVGEGLLVHIQGLMLWPTGPLDVQRYERTFENS